ncbi:MAG: hypothetical protein ACXWW7_17005 [Nocardioides sp.]
MSTLGRRTLLWMIPLNLLLIAWVWFGRVFFGVGGWFLLIFMMTVVPVLLIGLLLTTVLAFTQPGRPRSLTRPQAQAQLATWVGMFLAGAFVPDFGDTEESYTSLLTQLFGRSDALLDLSWTLMTVFAGASLVAWVILLVTLTGGRRPADDTAAVVTAAR